MSGQTRPQPPLQRHKGKTPAERAEEFSATQRRLKREAADRRDAARAVYSGAARGAETNGSPRGS